MVRRPVDFKVHWEFLKKGRRLPIAAVEVGLRVGGRTSRLGRQLTFCLRFLCGSD